MEVSGILREHVIDLKKPPKIDVMCDGAFNNKSQRFEEPSKSDASIVGVSSNSKFENVLAELMKCKTKIKSKRCCIQKLKNNLKCACIVARTLASTKKESGSLKQHLSHAHSECADLLEKYRNNVQIINSLTRENMMLRNMLDNVEHFVLLGYRELQKIKLDDPEETSVLAQLRKLIVSNGEFHSNYCNEHEKHEQLKQTNRFLKNKNSILEYNVQSCTEQIKFLEYRAIRMQRESVSKNTCFKSKSSENIDTKLTISEDNLNPIKRTSTTTCAFDSIKTKETSKPIEFKCQVNSKLDFPTHLSMIKNLLNDQDALLRSLQVLSQECLDISKVDQVHV